MLNKHLSWNELEKRVPLANPVPPGGAGEGNSNTRVTWIAADSEPLAICPNIGATAIVAAALIMGVGSQRELPDYMQAVESSPFCSS